MLFLVGLGLVALYWTSEGQKVYHAATLFWNKNTARDKKKQKKQKSKFIFSMKSSCNSLSFYINWNCYYRIWSYATLISLPIISQLLPPLCFFIEEPYRWKIKSEESVNHNQTWRRIGETRTVSLRGRGGARFATKFQLLHFTNYMD